MHDIYYNHLKRLPDYILFDIDAFDHLSNQQVLDRLKMFNGRIILDGFGKGNANYKTLEFLKPRGGVKFDRIMLLSNMKLFFSVSRGQAASQNWLYLQKLKLLKNLKE